MHAEILKFPFIVILLCDLSCACDSIISIIIIITMFRRLLVVFSWLV